MKAVLLIGDARYGDAEAKVCAELRNAGSPHPAVVVTMPGSDGVYEFSAPQFLWAVSELNELYWHRCSDSIRDTRMKIRRVYIESKDPVLLAQCDAEAEAVYARACPELENKL